MLKPGIPAIPYLLLVFFLLLLAAGLVAYFFHPLFQLYETLTDRAAVREFVEAGGAAAPFIFILIQILQVILAPLPGEISGFVGGYLFGGGHGFLYSSLALTLGSAINFWIGRFLGYRWVRKWVPAEQLERMDVFLKRQGLVLVLAFFIFPGFPKDYLSLFLGGTAMPFKAFIFLAGIGQIGRAHV